jgi:hypothetical protein
MGCSLRGMAVGDLLNIYLIVLSGTICAVGDGCMAMVADGGGCSDAGAAHCPGAAQQGSWFCTVVHHGCNRLWWAAGIHP